MEINEVIRETCGKAQEYRLKRITDIQRDITSEHEKRAALCYKYQKGVRILGATNNVLTAISTGLTMAGAGVVATIVAAPIATGLAVAASVVGVICMIGGQVNKKFALKLEKHEKIKTLAEAKLNSISDIVSKALEDDCISDEEFSLIRSELEKFSDMKEEVRNKTKASIDDETKQSFLGRKREELIESFKKRET